MPRWPSQTRRKFGPKISPEERAAAVDAERKRLRALADARRNRALTKAKAKLASKRPNPTRQPRVSPQLERALDVLADAAAKGERITLVEAARRAGCARETLSKALRRDVVASRAAAKVRELIGGQGLILAGARLVELIRSDSDYVSLDAAKHTLAIAGIKPREQGAPAGGGVTINLVLKHVQQPPISGTSPPLIDVTPSQAVDDER